MTEKQRLESIAVQAQHFASNSGEAQAWRLAEIAWQKAGNMERADFCRGMAEEIEQ